MSTTAYRSEETILLARREELLVRRAGQEGSITGLLDLASVQSARRVAGAVGLVGLVLTGLGYLGALVFASSDLGVSGIRPPNVGGMLTVATVAIPVVTALVATSGHLARALVVRGALRTFLAPTANVRADVARLESSSDLRALQQKVQSSSATSLALLVAVAAIFLPLLLHLALWAVVGLLASPTLLSERWLADFDRWVVYSGWLMALSYIVLLVRVFSFRRRALAVHPTELRRFGLRYGFATLGFTSLAACVPGAALFFIPPVVSFVTGLVILPALFALYGAVLGHERLRIESSFDAAV